MSTLSISSRMKVVNPDGTATREFLLAIQGLLDRTGGATGVVPANSITFSPTGGISSNNVQAMGAELDAEKQPRDATLTGIAAVTTAANKLIYFTGVDVAAATDLSGFARTLLDDPDPTGMRTTLGLGAMATQDAASVSITGGFVLLGTGQLGYRTGNGGTVTQATDKTTGVTLNKMCGDITMNTAALTGNTTVSFTLTNSNIDATDLVLTEHNANGTSGAYKVTAQVSSAGSCLISVRNLTSGTLGEPIVIRFAVFKAATS